MKPGREKGQNQCKQVYPMCWRSGGPHPTSAHRHCRVRRRCPGAAEALEGQCPGAGRQQRGQDGAVREPPDEATIRRPLGLPFTPPEQCRGGLL